MITKLNEITNYKVMQVCAMSSVSVIHCMASVYAATGSRELSEDSVTFSIWISSLCSHCTDCRTSSQKFLPARSLINVLMF